MRVAMRFGEDRVMESYEVGQEIVDFYTYGYDEASRLSASAHEVPQPCPQRRGVGGLATFVRSHSSPG
jgi:hypothetical protein